MSNDKNIAKLHRQMLELQLQLLEAAGIVPSLRLGAHLGLGVFFLIGWRNALVCDGDPTPSFFVVSLIACLIGGVILGALLYPLRLQLLRYKLYA